MTCEITSNKVVIIAQSLAIFTAFTAAAVVLEYSGLLRTSILGRLSQGIGLPVAGAALVLVGVSIAVASAIDSWAFSVRVDEDGLQIVDRLGTSHVRYSNIEALKLIPAYGAGIALKDKDEWLSGFVGSDGDRVKAAQISGVVSGAYGCDIAFVNKRLKCGSKAFLELVSAKTGVAVS